MNQMWKTIKKSQIMVVQRINVKQSDVPVLDQDLKMIYFSR